MRVDKEEDDGGLCLRVGEEVVLVGSKLENHFADGEENERCFLGGVLLAAVLSIAILNEFEFDLPCPGLSVILYPTRGSSFLESPSVGSITMRLARGCTAGRK